MDKAYDQTQIKKIVYNDLLGYAIVYYNPVTGHDILSARSEDRCEHQKHRILHALEYPEDDENAKFHEEVEAMIRRREREDAEKEIRKICEKVNDLYSQVEQADISRREFLSHRVKEQIKGKSADEICDILVQDVLQHSKCVPRPKPEINHKAKFRILQAAVNGSASTKPQTRKAVRELIDESPDVFERVEEKLNKSLQSEIHTRKYTRLLDKIQNDIILLKRRCTEKIDFN